MHIHADTCRHVHTKYLCVSTKIYLTTLSTLKVSTNIDFIRKRYLTDMLSQQDMLALWCQNSVVTFSRKKKKILTKASSHSFCVSSSASEDMAQLNPPERLPLSPGFAEVIFH